MSILLLEDRGSVSFPLREGLEREGHRVLLANGIYDADSLWKDRENNRIDCMIIDLNMPPDGLAGQARLDAEGDGWQLTGWFWLKYHVLAGLENKEALKERVIVYSDYVGALKEYLRKRNSHNELDSITCIPKREASAAMSLLARLREIAKLPMGELR